MKYSKDEYKEIKTMNSSENRYKKFASLIMISFMLSAIVASTTIVRPVFGDPAWWNINWEFRKPITIYHSNVTSDLTNFPVLVNITDSDLATKAQVDGDDIVFTDPSGLKLDHEIEYYNGTSGLLVAWVKIPSLSSTEDTTIYMYYGNPDALNQENTQQVWDADYMMTQHFNERYENGECRFWGMIAPGTLPQTEVMDQLVNLPNSLKTMGATNPNGWGLAYYNTTEPTIRRGQPAANTDPNFNTAALELATSGASIGVGHVRKSASPPYNIPDPHPFNRTKMGKTWVFAHHGTISQTVLVNLIGTAYLTANPPQYGNSTDTYNDSELYFIYVLKCIEENAGNIRKGIAQAVTAISAESTTYNMNFVFSDGTTLWAFRRGDTTHLVYYYYNSTSPVYSAVASQYPTSSQGSWIALSNYNLVEMNRTDPPVVITDIRGYAPLDHFDSTANNNDGTAYNGVVISAEGKINGGDLFDGVNDYVSVNDSSTLDGDGNWAQLSIELWVKTDVATPSGQRILRKGPSSGSDLNSYQVGFQSASMPVPGALYFDVWHGGAVTTYYEVDARSNLLTAGTWYHVVGVYDTAVGSKIYINGAEVVVTTVQGTATGNVGGSPAQPLFIGCRWSGAYPTGNVANFFKGTLDETRISRVARSADWIAASFKNQNDPSHFSSVGTEEGGQPTTMRITPATTDAVLGADYTVYVEMVGVVDLYAWEFQLDYNATILDLTSCSVVAGGLNEPTNTYYNLTDEVNGHVWWAVSTTRPTTTGISYSQHNIFEIHYHTMAAGTSSLSLHGTLLSDSNGDPIAHEVVNGSITVTGAIDLTVENVRILDQGCSIYANDTYADGMTKYYYPVEVTVHNLGTGPAGPFLVKLEVFWINGLTTEAMREESVSGLLGGASTVVNFTNFLNPSRTQYYRLIATVDSTNTVTESNETNNTLALDNVKVTVVGDANGDGVVNILDGVVLTRAWTGTPELPQWNVKSDVNHDGTVNILDGTRLSLNWGARW
jgi:predicted glutamine amidotransferase